MNSRINIIEEKILNLKTEIKAIKTKEQNLKEIREEIETKELAIKIFENEKNFIFKYHETKQSGAV